MLKAHLTVGGRSVWLPVPGFGGVGCRGHKKEAFEACDDEGASDEEDTDEYDVSDVLGDVVVGESKVPDDC